MAYRRSPRSSRERNWSAWIEHHRETLAALGLPMETYVDLASWDQFIESGEVYAWRRQDVLHGFHFSDLDDRQMDKLLEFVAHSDEFRPENTSLIGFLRVRLGRGG